MKKFPYFLACMIRRAELMTTSGKHEFMKYPKRLQLCFTQIPPRVHVRVCVGSLDRMKKSSGKHAYGNGGCIMKTTRSLELGLLPHLPSESLTSSLFYSRERIFCKLHRDTKISYFVQVPRSHLLFTESKKKGDSCSFHYHVHVKHVEFLKSSS